MIDIIFISYVNRSGSTFLVNKLNKYKDIYVCPEGEQIVSLLLYKPNDNFNRDIKNKLRKLFDNDGALSYWKISENIIDKLSFESTCFESFFTIIDFMRSIEKPEASKIVFKANNIFKIANLLNENLAKRFKIKSIALIRDPRAIFNSQNLTLVNNKYINSNPVITSNQWLWFTNEISTIKQIKIILFEKLIMNFEKELDEIKEFIQLKNFEQRDNEKLNIIKPNLEHIHANIDDNPDLSKISNWKNSLSIPHSLIIQNITKSNLLKFNYEIIKEPYNFKSKLLSFWFKIRIFLKIDNY